MHELTLAPQHGQRGQPIVVARVLCVMATAKAAGVSAPVPAGLREELERKLAQLKEARVDQGAAVKARQLAMQVKRVFGPGGDGAHTAPVGIFRYTTQVRFSDEDTNRHLNQSRYPMFVYDAIRAAREVADMAAASTATATSTGGKGSTKFLTCGLMRSPDLAWRVQQELRCMTVEYVQEITAPAVAMVMLRAAPGAVESDALGDGSTLTCIEWCLVKQHPGVWQGGCCNPSGSSTAAAAAGRPAPPQPLMARGKAYMRVPPRTARPAVEPVRTAAQHSATHWLPAKL